jgi:hypothetical protein
VTVTVTVCHLADSLSIVPVGIGKQKSSKMAQFVFKCNEEDYLSEEHMLITSEVSELQPLEEHMLMLARKRVREV